MNFTTYNVVSMQDFDKFVEEKLGRPWSCGQNEEGAYNGTVRNFSECYNPNDQDPTYGEPARAARIAAWLASPVPECPGRLDQPGYAESVTIYNTDIVGELIKQGHLPEDIDFWIHFDW